MRFPDDASPGEIYPSIVDLPAAGCWRLTLRWSGHAASIDLEVRALSARTQRLARSTAVERALRRPLRLPRLPPGGRCPVSRTHLIASFIAPGLGPGPVYPVFGGSTLRFASPSPSASSPFAGSAWGGNKMVWVAAARYRGPFLVRGRQLDGPRLVRFGAGRLPAASIELSTPGATSIGEPDGWRAWPSYTRLEAAGCYPYQVDGTDFSTVIVFRGVMAPGG
jgi:hypothetical protein